MVLLATRTTLSKLAWATSTSLAKTATTTWLANTTSVTTLSALASAMTTAKVRTIGMNMPLATNTTSARVPTLGLKVLTMIRVKKVQKITTKLLLAFATTSNRYPLPQKANLRVRFVKEGDEVKKDQILIRLDNKNFTSSYGESKLRLDELQAKFMRLDAEANDKDFDYDEARDANNSKAIRYELSLHNSNIDHLNEQIGILTEQIHQRQSELVELKNKISQTQNSYNLVLKEKAIMEPIFKKGLVSEVEYIQLQRRVNDLRGELDAAVLAVPRVESTIKEAKNKIEEAKLAFKNNAKKELNEVSAEIARINESQISLSDRVERTYVRSPVNGIVSKMMVHTVSGVIKPGENIAEIVPLEDKLVAEVKVKPADVAFLRPGLDTMVKFTAYDFSIYGGLKGKVTQISADTETNEKTGESYYLVRIETEKNYLGSEEKPLRIKVGMIVSADIITGKKTILDYLLKPILKAKQNALTER